MSDQSSESSCEWVLINENDDLILENAEAEPLNLEPNNECISFVASESLISLLSCEELEWQYDPLESNSDLLSYDLSYVEDLDLNEENIEDGNIDQTEDVYLNSCASSLDFQEDFSMSLASVQKTHCYKHNRNDRLNFILNIMLALVVSAAIGLGTGHFLGWSHKCWTNTNVFKNEPYHYELPGKAVKQTTESFTSKEIGIMYSPTFSENLLNAVEPLFKSRSRYDFPENCKEPLTNNIATYSILKPPVSDSANLDLPVKNAKSNNSTDLEYPLILNTVPSIEWSKMSEITIPVKKIDDHISDFDNEAIIDADQDDIVHDKEINLESDLFKQHITKKDSTKSKFTNQLQDDLIQVIQTLNAIAFSRISSNREKPSSVTEFEEIQKSYIDLQNTIMDKISFIDGFIQSEEYKQYPKFGVKHLKKMVYSLVDYIDHALKTSLRTFAKDSKKINSYKFSKNLSKIIINFNTKWQKNQNIWAQNLERTKNQELKQNTFRESKQRFFEEYKEKSYKKETKHQKRKVFVKNYSKHKYERYSLKS